jgi:preprotein translocase subunit SecE
MTAENQGMRAVDIAKLAFAVLLVVAGIAGYYWLADSALVLRVLAVLAGIAAGLVAGYFSTPGREFAQFAGDALGEVKKVVWPTRKETMQTTAAVFAFVVVMALFLWLTDKTLEWALYELILRRT